MTFSELTAFVSLRVFLIGGYLSGARYGISGFGGLGLGVFAWLLRIVVYQGYLNLMVITGGKYRQKIGRKKERNNNDC